MKKKAFTLVELIVVITILAILGTIAFISLSGYSKEARDAKRVTDTSSLLSKINIEETRGTQLSDLITTDEPVTLQILGEKNPNVQTFREANFKTLKEDEKNFRDPSNKNQNYPLAYAIGGKGKNAYKFIQIATISEKENKAVIKGNYYRSEDPKDAKSLFLTGGTTQEDGKELENGGETLPYPPTSGGNTGGGNTSGGGESSGGGEKFSCTGESENAEIFNKDNLTEDTPYQNTDPNGKCYLKCLENYTWNGSSCVISHIGEVEVWIDPKTNFIREANPTGMGSWATDNSYTEPTWNTNTQEYTYPTGEATDYPAFEYCTKLPGGGWRLPTKNELTVLVNYKTKNIKEAYSNHPGISSNSYWSSTSSANNTTRAWIVYFGNALTSHNDKTSSNYIVCIHD